MDNTMTARDNWPDIVKRCRVLSRRDNGFLFHEKTAASPMESRLERDKREAPAAFDASSVHNIPLVTAPAKPPSKRAKRRKRSNASNPRKRL